MLAQSAHYIVVVLCFLAVVIVHEGPECRWRQEDINVEVSVPSHSLIFVKYLYHVSLLLTATPRSYLLSEKIWG